VGNWGVINLIYLTCFRYYRYYDREDLAIEQEGCVPVPQPLRG